MGENCSYLILIDSIEDLGPSAAYGSDGSRTAIVSFLSPQLSVYVTLTELKFIVGARRAVNTSAVISWGQKVSPLYRANKNRLLRRGRRPIARPPE
ncbi:hypothetical protein EVAR_86381_1 [Eumeta japonica]|uniref:Uncharacterized protein n=1 Tax=Eumeta variegata TaxID=151549 RepID=A0A4C1WBD4_EUMVA|nr:hypothetical protein EVAR_86381_1 [Eumeta japonica]